MTSNQKSEPDREDRALVARVLSGDHQAYAGLVDRYRNMVYTIALRTVGIEADAEDVAQDAFVRAFRALPGFRGDSKFSSWLFRITVNRALEHVRHRSRGPFHDASEEASLAAEQLPASDADRPDRALIEEDFQRSVRKAVDELPLPYQMVVTLYHLEGRKYREVAEILGVPIGTVKTHLHRARGMLRERILRKRDVPHA